MRMEVSLQHKMEQRLKLAPQIIQSIEILQLNAIGLENYLKQEMLENPTLEVEDAKAGADGESPEAESESSETEELSEEDAEFERLDEEFERMSGLGSGGGGSYSGDEGDKKLEAMQNTAARGDTLQDYLSGQFNLLDASEDVRDAGDAIIYNIDEQGYLAYSLEEIHAGMEDPVPFEAMEEALELVQTLDPPGVGARDLKECLLIQIGDNSRYAFERMLLEEHFEDLQKNRLPKVSKETGEPIELIKEALAFIKTLNPKPGASFSAAQANYIIPDVSVELVDGKYEIRLEDEFIPRVRISRRYQKMLHEKKDDKDVREYIKKKIDSAKWLIESIQQRQNTVKRISKELVEYQKEFLDKGIDGLRPLKMQYIADKVGVHVSTVSRAISGKYIQTPRGVFAMKFFFSGGTTTTDGEEESVLAVKQKVRDIIEEENKKKPLSDRKIADELEKMGLEIARRTVTKYRKQLGIPSSRQRRVY